MLHSIQTGPNTTKDWVVVEAPKSRLFIVVGNYVPGDGRGAKGPHELYKDRVDQDEVQAHYSCGKSPPLNRKHQSED